MATISPFLNAGNSATPQSLAVLQLQRDALVPVLLSAADTASEDYVEGVVENTRFGSFPHSTLINQAWGSQILASKVDTGSKGRSKKRKREAHDERDDSRESTPVKAAITAGTGFAHLLQPTPESWTISLPHRTQVVYTPDYSYVLQRLRVAPGSHIIEAGAGSGSFTHASVRAIFNGYPSSVESRHKSGHVYSFEYHRPRVETLREELIHHGLSELVTVTHRDVYEDGFLLSEAGMVSPVANAIFLDLPAPWKALRNLTRRVQPGTKSVGDGTPLGHDTSAEFVSPLDPRSPVSVCCFIPCIEQVQSAVGALRLLGWVDIDMVEIAHRRIDVRRERVGFAEEGLRGSNAGPKDVEETMERLLEVEGRFKAWGEQKLADSGKEDGSKKERKTQKQQRQERNRQVEKERKIYKEGVLVSRPESEIKTHTSYLVFAILPVEWSAEDERAALERWGSEEKGKATDGQQGEKSEAGQDKAIGAGESIVEEEVE
ncbi:hypothetical protein ANO11243_019130 [Dothideomycetidae sp. 11243]|nr:hypothetical protein ANO11243_019130 [fungal sp. No.11243]